MALKTRTDMYETVPNRSHAPQIATMPIKQRLLILVWSTQTGRVSDWMRGPVFSLQQGIRGSIEPG